MTKLEQENKALRNLLKKELAKNEILNDELQKLKNLYTGLSLQMQVITKVVTGT